MNKSQFAQVIDAYADAKATGNKYLVQHMINDLEEALNTIFGLPPAPSTMPEVCRGAEE